MNLCKRSSALCPFVCLCAILCVLPILFARAVALICVCCEVDDVCRCGRVRSLRSGSASGCPTGPMLGVAAVAILASHPPLFLNHCLIFGSISSLLECRPVCELGIVCEAPRVILGGRKPMTFELSACSGSNLVWMRPGLGLLKARYEALGYLRLGTSETGKKALADVETQLPCVVIRRSAANGPKSCSSGPGACHRR